MRDFLMIVGSICFLWLILFNLINTFVVEESIHTSQIIKADSLCENNGGVDYYEYDIGNIDVFCMNSAKFDNIRKEEK